MIDQSTVLSICQMIITEAGELDSSVGVNKSFLDYAQLTLDVIKSWPQKRRESTRWLKDFLLQLHKLRDDFAKIVELDPPVLYKPVNPMILGYHKSLARIRYVRTGNRCSKTQGVCQDLYWQLTSSHPYRPLPPQPTSVIILGPDYTNYAVLTFEPKWVYGETGNTLSPMFPENGKWFHSYNRNTKTLRLGCRQCAEKGKAASCPHQKPVLNLASDQGKPQNIAGSQHGHIQLDEQIQYKFMQEAEKRIESVPNSGISVSETPVIGKSFWTHEKLTLASELDNNKFFNPATKKTCPNITLHTCSQYEGNIVPHEIIDAWCVGKTRQEIELRVYGLPTAEGAHHVFDLTEINSKRDHKKIPWRGELRFPGERPTTIRDLLREVEYESTTEIRARKRENGPYYLWKKPKVDGQYIIAADVAQGLSEQDSSVAHCYRLLPKGNQLVMEHVAKIRGWINPTPYAHMLYKLSLFYNNAPIVVERNGPGHTVIYELWDECGCSFLYQPQQQIADVDIKDDRQYGLSTTGESKPPMLAMAQNMLLDRKTKQSLLRTWDDQFLGELESYVQVTAASGRSILYEGEGGAHDDEVMAYALAAFVVKTDPNVYDWERMKTKPDNCYDHLSDYDRKFWKDMNERLEHGPEQPPRTLVD